MDDLCHSSSDFNHIIKLLNSNDYEAATAQLQHCTSNIPQSVFEAALVGQNYEFIRQNIERSSMLTKHNILDQAVWGLDVVLAQSVIPHIAKNSYPFLAATLRVYKKENGFSIMDVLSTHLTANEKIILAKGLLENVLPIQLSDFQIQDRINCLTRGVDEQKIWTVIKSCSSSRTQEAFTAALDCHQNQRIEGALTTPEISRSRKL